MFKVGDKVEVISDTAFFGRVGIVSGPERERDGYFFLDFGLEYNGLLYGINELKLIPHEPGMYKTNEAGTYAFLTAKGNWRMLYSDGSSCKFSEHYILANWKLEKL